MAYLSKMWDYHCLESPQGSKCHIVSPAEQYVASVIVKMADTLVASVILDSSIQLWFLSDL